MSVTGEIRQPIVSNITNMKEMRREKFTLKDNVRKSICTFRMTEKKRTPVYNFFIDKNLI